MKPDEFCRWLQGFAELHDGEPTAAQWKSIREHLQTVFVKVTPPVDHENPAPGATTRIKIDEDQLKEVLRDVGPSWVPSSTRIC